MSFCEIVLVGNVGRDPETRYTGSGQAVCTFSLAVGRSRKVNDAWVEETTWFKVTAWSQLAERLQGQIKKGQQVLVAADRIEASAYISKEGEARASLEVTARQVRMMGRRDGEGGGSFGGGNAPSGGGDFMDDLGDAPSDVNDIPF